MTVALRIPVQSEHGPISTSDLAVGLDSLKDSQPDYIRAEQYYSGDIAEFTLALRMKRVLAAQAKAFRINFASIPVDAVAERLKLALVTATPAGADAALQEEWSRNLMTLFSRKLLHEMCKFGDSYLMAWPSEEDDSNDASGVDMWIVSPLQCRMIYDAERPLKKRFAIRMWEDGNLVRVDLYYADRIEKLAAPKGSKEPGAFKRYFDDEGDAWPYDNPHGQIPVFHFRNDAQYGTPEHLGFYGVQNAVFKLIVGHMTGVDYTVLPQRYKLAETGIGQPDASAVDLDDFAVEDDDDEETALDSRPGGLWDLKNTKAVGQFDAADPSHFTDPALTYLRMGAQITNTPTHKIDPTGDAPSGESLRTAEGPFTAKVDDRQEWTEPTWQEALRFVLLLRGYSDAEVSIRWEPSETADDSDGWNVAKVKLECGVPIQQVLVEQGYDATQVEEWFGDFDPDTEHDAELLLKIGQALVQIGTAQGLGVVSAEQVQLIIAAVIGEDETDDAA